MQTSWGRPYRSALALTVGTALGAALVVGFADVLLTISTAEGLEGGDAGAFLGRALGLYGLFALLAGLAEGIVLGAIRATHRGATFAGLWRGLADDPEIDRAVAAWLLAAMGAAAVLAAMVAVASFPLVANAVRKGPGALLLGAFAAAAVAFSALVAYPLFRLTRLVVQGVPRLGRIPATFVVLVLVLAVGAAAALFVVVRGLDWRGLLVQVGGLLALALLFVVQLVLVAIVYGPLGAVRERIPARGIIVVALAALAAVGGGLALAGEVSPRVAALLAVDSGGPRVLAALAKRVADRDGDGYAALLGGGDCDDANPEVHPGAEDLPGNGIDENCLNGDAGEKGGGGKAARLVAPPGSKQAAFKWTGNLVLIGVDTLRADRLGVSGYQRKGRSLTPRMDELIKRGVWFRRTWAQAPHTPRSFPSIFTSRLPSQVDWNDPGANYPVVQPSNVTLFEALSDAGWKTIGMSSHFYFTEERGIRQGFAEYDNEGALDIKGSNKDIASPRVAEKTRRRLKALAASKERFALFVHLFEPHSTYVEHEEFPVEARGGPESLMEKYDWEVAFVDRYVGEIVDAVAAAGLADDTMIVLFSDHGESFGAHRVGGQRIFFHGQTLYEEVVRVPLVIVAPKVAARVVDDPAMLIDLAPTLVDAVKARMPDEFAGRSLLPALVGEPLERRPAYAELLPYPNWPNGVKTMIDEAGKWKIIYRVTENLFELYDLEQDPTEQKNLMEADQAHAAEMKGRIVSWMESEL